MKKLIALIAFVPLILFAAETKKVCNMQKDRKGKEVKICKDVKVHKKLDGTKVPPK
jgi:hypothetical protein